MFVALNETTTTKNDEEIFHEMSTSLKKIINMFYKTHDKTIAEHFPLKI